MAKRSSTPRWRKVRPNFRLVVSFSFAFVVLASTLRQTPLTTSPTFSVQNDYQRNTSSPTLDYALEDGYFFHDPKSGNSPLLGFVVDGAMAQALDTAGGIALMGLPVSQSWTDAEGRLCQTFQRGILRVSVDGQGVPHVDRPNLLDLISRAGKDDWLEQSDSIPPATSVTVDGGFSGLVTTAKQLLLLGEDWTLLRVYLGTPDWRDRFGLPLVIKRYENVITLRAEHAVLQHWLVRTQEWPAGAVAVVDPVSIVERSGVVPAAAMKPVLSPRYGWLHVDGRQIVDGLGNVVRIAGVNWSGFELQDYVPRGLAVQDYTAIIDRIAALGFNTIRIPFSNELVERDPVPDPGLVASCQACQGRRALQIMDLIVAYSGQKGLRIILDNHFSAANDQAGSTLWYTEQFPDAAWRQDWLTLARRFRNNPAVIGFDLRNEPHGPASWGSGDTTTDWRLAAESIGADILDINPHLLIIVEGIEQFPNAGGGMDLTWWGANLEGVRQFPVRLPSANLLYSPHEYGPSVWRQSWFNLGTTSESLLAVWKHYWAYLNLDSDLPLLVGEIGTGNSAADIADGRPGSQGQWFQAILALLKQRDNLHWLYWTIDAEDQFALMNRDYDEVANPTKLAGLATIMGQSFVPLPSYDDEADLPALPGEVSMR